MTKRVLSLSLGVVVLLAGLHAQVQPGAKLNLSGESLGISGYDPVSYFPEGGGKPQKGLIKLSETYQGVTYRFRTPEHLDAFKANPAKYVPAYGGWCAWAVAELNKRVDVDPLSYEIQNGRLLLFYRDPELDTRAMWTKAPADLHKKAEKNWPG